MNFWLKQIYIDYGIDDPIIMMIGYSFYVFDHHQCVQKQSIDFNSHV